MAIPSEVNDLLNFLIILCVYLIPCLIGSSVSFYLKNRAVFADKKKRKTRMRIMSLFINAIIPAVIISFINIYWGEKLANSNMLFAVAVIAGALGEDITKIFTNIKTAFDFIKMASHSKSNIDPIVSKIVDAVKEAQDEDNSKDDKSDK